MTGAVGGRPAESQQVMAALPQMTKLNISRLKQSYKG